MYQQWIKNSVTLNPTLKVCSLSPSDLTTPKSLKFTSKYLQGELNEFNYGVFILKFHTHMNKVELVPSHQLICDCGVFSPNLFLVVS